MYLGEILTNLLVSGGAEVGEKDGPLYAGTSLAYEVLGDIVSHFVAFYVIHYEKQHVSYRSFSGVDDVEYSMDSLVQ